MNIEKYWLLLFLIFATTSCEGQSNINSPTNNSATSGSSLVKSKFESKEGGFKINFPCEPMKSEKQIDSDFGNTTIYFLDCGNETANYSVSFRDFTKKITNPKEVFVREKQMRIMGLEESVKIVSDIEKTVNGFPAVYFETELNAGDVLPKSGLNSELHSIKGQRHYSVNVIVMCKKGQTPQDISKELKDKTKEFIDSFEIFENK